MTEEIVIRQGRAYVFPSDSKEVIIIEPSRGRLEILDVGRRVQTEVSFRSLASLRAARGNRRIGFRLSRQAFGIRLPVRRVRQTRRAEHPP